MANSLRTEIHHPGEPWSVDKMEHIPHLHHIAKKIREELSATNKTLRDIDLQNQQQYDSFIERFNNDLIFRLIITRDYYQLSILFKDPRSSTRWTKFLDETNAFQKRQHQKHHLQLQELHKITTIAPTAQQLSYHALLSWTHPDPSLSNIQKWQHYSQQLQQITFNYHVQRAQIHQNSLNAGMNRIDNVLAHLMLADGEGYRMGVAHFEALKSNHSRSAKAVIDIPLYKSDGSFDLEAAKRQEKEMEALNIAMDVSLDSFFKTYGNKNPVINMLQTKHESAKATTAGNLNALYKAFDEQSSELKTHVKRCCAASKKEIDGYLSAVINLMENVDIMALDDRQRGRFANLEQKIQGHREALKTIVDFDKIQSILAQSTQEITQIMDILPDGVKQRVQLVSAELAKMMTIEAPTQRAESLASHVESAVPAFEKSSVHEDSESMAQAPKEHSDAVAQPVQLDSEISESAVIVVPIQEANNQPKIPVEPTIEAVPVAPVPAPAPRHEVMPAAISPSIIDMQRDIKAALRESRGGQPSNTGKKMVDTQLDFILGGINRAEKRKPFTEEEQELIQAIKEKINNIKSFENYQEIPPEVSTALSELSENLKELGEQCQRLSPLKAKLDQITSSPESTAQNESSISLYQS